MAAALQHGTARLVDAAATIAGNAAARCRVAPTLPTAANRSLPVRCRRRHAADPHFPAGWRHEHHLRSGAVQPGKPLRLLAWLHAGRPGLPPNCHANSPATLPTSTNLAFSATQCIGVSSIISVLFYLSRDHPLRPGPMVDWGACFTCDSTSTLAPGPGFAYSSAPGSHCSLVYSSLAHYLSARPCLRGSALPAARHRCRCAGCALLNPWPPIRCPAVQTCCSCSASRSSWARQWVGGAACLHNGWA